MANTMTRVGLDVHARQTHLFALDLVSGEVFRQRIEGPRRRRFLTLIGSGGG
jgi:hypothetical protein